MMGKYNPHPMNSHESNGNIDERNLLTSGTENLRPGTGKILSGEFISYLGVFAVFIAIVAVFSMWLPLDHDVKPGETFYFIYSNMTITNHTTRTIVVHGQAAVAIINDTDRQLCFPVVVEDTEPTSLMKPDANGVMHVSAKNTVWLNAGFITSCIEREIGASALDYKYASLDGLVQSAKMHGLSFTQFQDVAGRDNGIVEPYYSTTSGTLNDLPLSIR